VTREVWDRTPDHGLVKDFVVRNEAEGDAEALYIDCVVPFPALIDHLPRLHIEAVKIKSFPVFGRVTAVQWQGKDFGSGLIDRLNRDDSLESRLLTCRRMEISTAVRDGASCWVISIFAGSAPFSNPHLSSVERDTCLLLSQQLVDWSSEAIGSGGGSA
jgi:hypothetical protein